MKFKWIDFVITTIAYNIYIIQYIFMIEAIQDCFPKKKKKRTAENHYIIFYSLLSWIPF